MQVPPNNTSKIDTSSMAFFSDPDLAYKRLVTHAEKQLAEIASSKSWRLITYYRQINAILITRGLNIFQKMVNSIYMTGILLGINHKDVFDPDQLKPPIPVEEWQIKLFGKTICRNGSIAVILHLYHVEMWDEIAEYLAHIPEIFDLFISVPQGKAMNISVLVETFPQAHIYHCINRGRDVAPFVEIYSAVYDSGYKLICKIHTKKSNHLSEGDYWRQFLLNELLGTEQRVKAILAIYNDYPEVGMLAPQGNLYSAIDISTMSNQTNIQRVGETLAIPLHNFKFEYPAGSMFWCRADSFQKLARSGIQTKDFPPERGQLNNTLAHALERFFGLLVIDRQQYIADTSVFKPLPETK
jgi:lipopolysaccharide biosynthesis protein